MEALVPWTLLLFGWVYLITDSVIFTRFRMGFASTGLYQMSFIYCPACTGFWVGFVLGATGLWPFNDTWYWAPGESAIAGVAVGAIWSRIKPNTAFEAEQGFDDDSEDSEEEPTEG